MIRPAADSDIQRLTDPDPFFTRILSLYESYAGYDFTDFWVQEHDGRLTAAVSRFEDKFSLWLTDAADLEEMAAFLRFQGAGAALFDARYPLGTGSHQSISGKILRYNGESYISDLELYTPETKELYRLLKRCESEIFIVPDYLIFLSDVTHRRNLGKCTVLAASVDGTLASAVMTVSETEHAVILGAVSTHPDYRRRGLSRELVRTLASRVNGQGRSVYVLSASEQNTRFYQNSGFSAIADFQEIFYDN